MRYRIEICQDLMHVLDENGNGYDAHVLVDRQAARDAMKMWATRYRPNNLDDARREMEAYFDSAG